MRLLLPQFNLDAHGTDWNDLARSRGLDFVRKQLQIGLAIVEQQQLAHQLVLSDIHQQQSIEAEEDKFILEQQATLSSQGNLMSL